MAIFAPILYSYVPTARRRSKRTSPRCEPAPKLSGILNKFQHVRSNSTLPSTPRLVADNGCNKPGIQGTDTIHRDSHNKNNNEAEAEDDNDSDFSTIEELLLTKPQEQGFTKENRGLDNTGGVEEVALEGRTGSVDYSGLALGYNSSGSPGNSTIYMLGDDDSSSGIAVDDILVESVVQDTGFFNNLENAMNSTIPVSSNPDKGPCIEQYDSSETDQSPQLVEPGALTSPVSCLFGESLHVSTACPSSHHAGFETTTSSYSSLNLSPPPRQLELLLENLRDDGVQSINGYGRAGSAFDIDCLDQGQWQEPEQREDNANTGSTRASKRQRLIQSTISVSEPNYHETESSDNDSDDEFNLGNDMRELCPKRRKRASLYDSQASKKRQDPLQQRSTRKNRVSRRSSKVYSPLGQGSRVTAAPNTQGQLPSPMPSTLETISTELPSVYSGGPSKDTLPTLTEITFRPQSSYCFSFTAIVQEGHNGQGVSFNQLAQLIKNTGYIGKIDDFTIKPLQDSFLLTGFSRHTPPRLMPNGTTVLTPRNVIRIHDDETRSKFWYDKVVASGEVESSSSDENDSLSDNNHDSNSKAADRYSIGDRSSMRKNIRWVPLDDQRLLAYMQEEKSWPWIFRKFSKRTQAAVRMRWNLIRPRGET
ncbi:hypothetical protein HYALB_00000984 [Hymenoscyphus albidus]|uniref:Myb-like domain-containing protein n=1 Tax=Hymenoscyphus albidus TaxID=595503 RepID=A0A9N9LXD7_9HELO|nr:hypothetical protein HYALB_00000984 [Hymenoscyphus albidus]